MKNTLDFVIIGVQKSATTWLYDCLKHHPKLDLKKSKDELYYYGGSLHEEKGNDWYWNQFKDDGGLKGCISVEYIEDELSPEKLFELNPNLKIFISLRDPIQRSISAYYWYFRKSLIKNLSIEKAFEKALEDFNASKKTTLSELITRSLYAEKIDKYLNKFGSSQISPILFESIKKDPQKALSQIFKQLEVEEYFEDSFFGTKPKQNSYNKWLLKTQRISSSKYVGKVFDFLNQLYCKIVPQKDPAIELNKEVIDQLKKIFDEDRKLLKSLAVKHNLKGFEKLDDFWY